ncbi:MAG TPA: YeeE/YedE family protein [Casimicrobiaceae bacterium]|nr:YeeE/YedE family protein [Casimicrobiaceae bacterium]
MSEANPAQLAPYVVAGAFALAFVFGAVANKTNFCTMGAVSDWVNMGDTSRMRMWLLAIAVAILGSNALQLAGVVDLSKSIYPSPNFTWLSYIVGGFCFGVGMTLGSGCGSKTLVRVGGGSLKSLVVFVFLAIAAYMTLRGLFGAFRVGVLERASITLPTGQDVPSLLARASGVDQRLLVALVGAVTAGALAAFVYSSRSFRENFDYTLGGVVVGLVVVGGWLVSGVIGHVAEDPNTLQEAFVATDTGRMESFSFVAPLAFTLQYFMLWTDKSEIVTYGIASVAGVIAGSAAYAIATGKFRWEGFRDAEDTANHIVGGLLMGFGGITALGCTIGQGITGFSTLALGSMITFLAIVAGSAATMKYQYWRVSRSSDDISGHGDEPSERQPSRREPLDAAHQRTGAG